MKVRVRRIPDWEIRLKDDKHTDERKNGATFLFGAWPCYMYFYIYIYHSEYIRVWSGKYEYRQ